MGRDRFRTVVKGIITNEGSVLLGKKEEDGEHPISGEWHILGGHMEHGEQPEKAMRREAKEETGLEIEVEELIDAMTWADRGKALSLLYHCRASSREAVARDDLSEVRWVPPFEVKELVHPQETKRLTERSSQAEFLDSLIKRND